MRTDTLSSEDAENARMNEITTEESAADAEACGSFTVVMPAFNEEGGIVDTLARLRECLATLGVASEIVVVDDGSTDRTAELLASQPGIRVVHHDRNLGYGAALKTGIRHARHPLIVITDADGTYPSERIPDLVARASSADMVVGARTSDNVEYSALRSIPKWFLKYFAEWLTRRKIPDINSGLRVFRKDAVARFLGILPDGFSFTTTITLAMLTNGYTVDYEPIDYRQRVGKSKIRPIRDTLRIAQLILRTGMYFAPLRVFFPVALLFGMAFLVSLVVDVVIRRDLTEATLVLLVASTQLAMFALLADMIDKRNR
jgi:glycosyltransferase involved in cell wall biosynthesis